MLAICILPVIALFGRHFCIGTHAFAQGKGIRREKKTGNAELQGLFAARRRDNLLMLFDQKALFNVYYISDFVFLANRSVCLSSECKNSVKDSVGLIQGFCASHSLSPERWDISKK